MPKQLGDLGLTNKVSLAAIAANGTAGTASYMTWFNEHILMLSGAASFLLVITMIFCHWMEQIRKNRTHKIETIRQELEIEKLRFELDRTRHPKLRSIETAPQNI